MEEETIIAVSVLGGACLLLLVLVAVVFSQLASLRRRLEDLANSGRLRVQKLTLENDKNHAFHNPTISPDEELARRGFSMYNAEDVEGGRLAPAERQTGGQFVDELAREIDKRQRQQRPPSPPYQPPQRDQNSLQRHQNSVQRDQNSVQRDQNSAQRDQNSLQRDQNSLQRDQNYAQRDQNSMQRDQTSLQRDHNPQQQNQAPPFLLQSIEQNKRKSRQLANPVANGGSRQSETNPNFIY